MVDGDSAVLLVRRCDVTLGSGRPLASGLVSLAPRRRTAGLAPFIISHLPVACHILFLFLFETRVPLVIPFVPFSSFPTLISAFVYTKTLRHNKGWYLNYLRPSSPAQSSLFNMNRKYKRLHQLESNRIDFKGIISCANAQQFFFFSFSLFVYFIIVPIAFIVWRWRLGHVQSYADGQQHQEEEDGHLSLLLPEGLVKENSCLVFSYSLVFHLVVVINSRCPSCSFLLLYVRIIFVDCGHPLTIGRHWIITRLYSFIYSFIIVCLIGDETRQDGHVVVDILLVQ